MDLVIGRGHYRRDRGAFVPWRQCNVLLEPTPTDEKRYNILSRPPMASAYTWGSGPIDGLFQRDGLFGGAKFAVSGNVLYMDGAPLGSIDGTGPVKWAGGNDELVVTRGLTAWSYNGTDLAAIVFPDDMPVRSVHWMAGWFFFVADNTGHFYWSDLNDGRTVDGLSFATAESTQDNLLDLFKVGDTFKMMGQESTETWVLTGDPDLPLTRVVQATFGRGIIETGCGAEIENTVYFIANDGLVCRFENADVRVSENSLEAAIRQSTEWSAFSFQYEGKVLFCIRLDSGTFALDLGLSNQPLELSTYGRDNWAALCAINVGPEVYFGDDQTGTVWAFNPDSTTDCGQQIMDKIWTAGMPVQQQPVPVSNVIVDGNTGDTHVVDTGDPAFDPIVEMRYSRDYGNLWSVWRAARWGKAGEYRRRARFGSCGMVAPPGLISEFRLQQVVPLRVADVKANEPLTGRGR